MSNFAIVRDAALALRDQLFRFLTTVPDVDLGFTDVTTDIVLSAPNDEVPDAARLSAYLYHIEPDAQLRNQPQLADGANGLLRAPLALCHRFLLTPLVQEESQNQLILGRIMQGLHDQPFIESLDGVPLDDSRGGGSPALRLTFEPMTLDELSRIWHAMGADHRLSVAYTMRTVLIDSALDARRTPRVELQHIGIGQRG